MAQKNVKTKKMSSMLRSAKSKNAHKNVITNKKTRDGVTYLNEDFQIDFNRKKLTKTYPDQDSVRNNTYEKKLRNLSNKRRQFLIFNMFFRRYFLAFIFLLAFSTSFVFSLRLAVYKKTNKLVKY